MESLTVQTPGSNSVLVKDLSMVINQSEHLLVSEPTFYDVSRTVARNGNFLQLLSDHLIR